MAHVKCHVLIFYGLIYSAVLWLGFSGSGLRSVHPGQTLSSHLEFKSHSISESSWKSVLAIVRIQPAPDRLLWQSKWGFVSMVDCRHDCLYNKRLGCRSGSVYVSITLDVK